MTIIKYYSIAKATWIYIPDSFLNYLFRIILNLLIIAYFQLSVGLIIPETSLSLSSEQDSINEMNWKRLLKS